MTKITFVASDGARTEVDARDGDVLMRVALDNSICGIEAECGGSMMCGTCHVYIDGVHAHLTSERKEGEVEILQWAKSEVRPTSRLSCQIEVRPEFEGMIVHLPEMQT